MHRYWFNVTDCPDIPKMSTGDIRELLRAVELDWEVIESSQHRKANREVALEDMRKLMRALSDELRVREVFGRVGV